MRLHRFAALLCSLALTAPAVPVLAQYMYIDANGDGVHTSADRLSPNGTPVTVDVWLRTNFNRDGSPAVCPTSDGALTINSYVVNMAVAGGTATFSAFVNRQGGMTTVLEPFASNTTEMTVGYGAGVIFPPGDYRLFTVTITPLTGTPSLAITGPSGLQTLDLTSFGSACSGNDFDNTLKLGSDWLDVDGLGPVLLDNAPPVVTAPATASGAENTAITLTATATDPDADPLFLSQTNNTPFFPASSSVGPIVNPSLSISGVPSFAAAGNYLVTWTAVQSAAPNLSATAITAVAIADGPKQNPVITAPPVVPGQPFVGVAVTASATDPDGTNVTLSQTNNAPFLTGPASAGPSPNPSITLIGTPGLGQFGSFTVQWSAIDSDIPAGTASAVTAVTITQHRNPVITAPATVVGFKGTALSITASALSPDGAFVTLCVTNVPAFLAGPSCVGPFLNPTITLAGTPGLMDAGSYAIQWHATDSVAGSASATTALSIADSNRPPVLDQPSDMAVAEGSTAVQQLIASDPDGNPLTYSKTGASPLFMSVSAAGLVALTPEFSDAGSHTGSAMVSDGGLADVKSFAIAVSNLNRCPTANAGGPYSGMWGFPITLDGSGSSDPDGDLLSYTWRFGDGIEGSGVNPTHTYAGPGAYIITLTVSDGACQASATTPAAIISQDIPAVAFTTGGNTSINLISGKPSWCVQIEPYNGSFEIADINVATIRMTYGGRSISSIGSKTSVGGDKNGNGVSEIQACFSKADLRSLFSGLAPGTSLITVSLTGYLSASSGGFLTYLDLSVKSNGSFLAATIAPNPLNPSAKISFATTKPGVVRVQLFDLNGRLLRTLLDERASSPGYHDVTIDARAGSGERLASGVYFLKVETEFDGTETKSLTILK